MTTERPANPFVYCGDYAVMDEDRQMAVVERKTLDNLLADFGTMPILHQRLAEPAAPILADCYHRSFTPMFEL